MITYEMLIEDDNNDGVYTISLVDRPAVETDYIMLSKDLDKIELKLDKITDEKQKILTGVALIPEMIIERDGFNIKFSADTIKKVSQNFLIQNKKDNVNIQHKVSVNSVFLVESWIIEDEKNDKANALGFDLPKGSWMVSFKVNDDKLWSEFLETKVLRGFSIEGNFAKKEIKMSKDLDEEIEDIVLKLAYTEEDLDKKYKWVRDKNGKDNCPSCLKFDGQVRTLRDWINTAFPGKPNGTVIAGLECSFPHDPFGTLCEGACQCELKSVEGTLRSRITRPGRRGV